MPKRADIAVKTKKGHRMVSAYNFDPTKHKRAPQRVSDPKAVKAIEAKSAENKEK